MNRLDRYLAGKLEEREHAGNLRQLRTPGNGIDLFSNDYLGLASTGILAGMMQDAAVSNIQLTGSTGSRLLSGNSVLAGELEQTMAAFHHAEAALLFNSGYDANVGLISAITSRDTTILYDELCHASLIDGVRLAQCTRRYRFAHNDVQDLASQLKRYASDGPVLVIVESVYSMDGDRALLADIARLCEAHDAQLIVDEAHATGVIGKHGEGMVCALGLEDKVFARVHTFGKALGCHGAAVVGSKLLKQYLVNFARTFIYTTALPGHSLQAIQCAYEYLQADGFTNEPLHDLIACFGQRVRESGDTRWKASDTPIQVLIAGGNPQCRQLAKKVQDAGMMVHAILHPTVPLGMERLRICLHTFNTKEQIDLLVDTLRP